MDKGEINMTIDDVMKQTFDSLKVDTRIYAEFEHDGGLYSGEFKVIWIDKERNCVSLTTPNESPYGTCTGVPLKNFFSLVNISNTNKEESNITDYGRILEKEYRDGMVVGAIYNFIGKGTDGWKYKYMLIGFEGYGEDLLLIFKSMDDTVFRITADDMGGFSLVSKPTEEKKDETDMKFLDEFDEIFDKKIRNRIDQVYSISCSNALPKPIQLVKKSEGYRFDEKEFYRATNSVRHFLIKDINNDRYEALYYGPTLDKAGMHIAFARSVGCGNVTCESAELYHDKIICDSTIDWTKLKLFKGDSLCTYDEIKMDDIFKREEKLEWDIDKLKVGKAYRIRDIDGNETDGIYRFLYEPTIPGQSSIVFAVVSDKGVVGTCHAYQEDLVSGKIKIYELACRKEIDEE
jgi:hypothetical protein